MLVGAPRSVANRLTTFGIDVQFLGKPGQYSAVHVNSHINPMSTQGMRESSLEGHNLLLLGRRAVSHALDCLGESLYAFVGSAGGVGLASTSKTASELPRILSMQSLPTERHPACS